MRAPRRVERWWYGALLLGGLAACHAGGRGRATTTAAAAVGAPLTVMSFNLRYDNPADGVNGWPNRRDRVAGVIRFHGAQVVGVQEALAGMLRDLDTRLPGMRVSVSDAPTASPAASSAPFSTTARASRRWPAARSGSLPPRTWWEVAGGTPRSNALPRGRASAIASPGARGCTSTRTSTTWETARASRVRVSSGAALARWPRAGRSP